MKFNNIEVNKSGRALSVFFGDVKKIKSDLKRRIFIFFFGANI